MNENNTFLPDAEETLKAKYGKVYRVGMTIPDDDENEKEFACHFRRPSIASYDRYIAGAARVGMVKASRTFMLDSVVDEDRERLASDMEEYPGVSLTIGDKLTELPGLTKAVNLKKL